MKPLGLYLYYSLIIILTAILFTPSCAPKSSNDGATDNRNDTTLINLEDIIEEEVDTIIIDSQMTLEEALGGTIAPQQVIDQLAIIDVEYISVDGKLHRGQIVANKRIESDIKHMFAYMLENDFVVEKAIPAVKYNWSDSLSMDDNNSYSFNYRNVSYSKHAYGMAIDINPRFNPLRWKNVDRENQPKGAVLDTTINGTLHPQHSVVKEFKRLGYRWGHTFSKYYDDHHFEKPYP